jgi:hypothetical protein
MFLVVLCAQIREFRGIFLSLCQQSTRVRRKNVKQVIGLLRQTLQQFHLLEVHFNRFTLLALLPI